MHSSVLNNIDLSSFSNIDLTGGADDVMIPFVSQKVPAGSPCPSDNYIEETINLNQVLVKKPKSTFCIRVIGDSMIDAGINEDDILIVDSSIEPSHNRIVVAAIDGDLTVKRLYYKRGKILLCPANEKYSPLEVQSDSLNIWGVVTFVIHQA